jgi:hypothetical protein
MKWTTFRSAKRISKYLFHDFAISYIQTRQLFKDMLLKLEKVTFCINFSIKVIWEPVVLSSPTQNQIEKIFYEDTRTSNNFESA